jgi:hypothetical protein
MTTKLMASVAVIALAISLQVLTLTYGWGLEVKSWAVIILIGFFGQVFTHAIARKILDE